MSSFSETVTCRSPKLLFRKRNEFHKCREKRKRHHAGQKAHRHSGVYTSYVNPHCQPHFRAQASESFSAHGSTAGDIISELEAVPVIQLPRPAPQQTVDQAK